MEDQTFEEPYIITETAEVKHFGGFLCRFLFFILCFSYLEILFHVAVYGNVKISIIYPIAFALVSGGVFCLLTSIFNKLINTFLAYIFTILFSVYYLAQFIYYKIFRTFLSLVSIGGAGDAMNFKSVFFAALKNNWYIIILLLLPIIILIILNIKVFKFQHVDWKKSLLCFGVTCVASTLSILILPLDGTENFSARSLFWGKYNLELSMDKLGVMVTTTRDGLTMFFGEKSDKNFEFAENDLDSSTDTSNVSKENNTNTESKVSSVVTYVPQVDSDINFKMLSTKTQDKDIINLCAYYSGVKPSYTNEYTGMFKDYNVIFITAESLSYYGISREATPTLYKIFNEGFKFNNYYCPMWYHSTIDGEYANCLSQYPSSSKWSFEESGDTYQPYALGNALNSLGYSSYAYHDFDATYYDRTVTHPNMGYTTFKAIGNGLELEFYNMYSDLECMQEVSSDFMDEDKFNMYFMSFSGHLPYNYSQQAMCLRNKEEAENALSGKYAYNESIAYVAAQMELDKALEYLIDELDKRGKLEKTVFIVAPDHYPYGLSDGVYNDLAGYNIENDSFELHRNGLAIWSASMEKSVKVNKVCASVDILPTILNLMGVSYDSRLLAGRDILSDSPGLVVFSNQSFITDMVKYNARTGETTYLVSESSVPENYVEEKIQEVEDSVYISRLNLDKDFFRFID